MKIILLYLVLLFSACAPLPGNILFDGLIQATPNNEVIIKEEIGLWKTTFNCNRILLDNGKSSFVAANILLNAGLIMGCAVAHWDEKGVIKTCEIYLAFDAEWIREHELRHCQGYTDQLY